MRKLGLKKRIALFLAVVMLIMNCVPAYATEINESNELDSEENSAYSSSENDDSIDNPDIVEINNEEINEDEDNIEINENENIDIDNDSVLNSDDNHSANSTGNHADTESIVSVDFFTENKTVLSASENGNRKTIMKTTLRGTRASIKTLGASGEPPYDEFEDGSGYKWYLQGSTLWISGNTAGENPVAGVADFMRAKGKDPGQVLAIEFVEKNEDNSDMTYSLQNLAFKDFTGLITFNVKKCISDIKYGAFVNCTKLQSFYVDPNHEKYCNNSDPADSNGLLYTTNCEHLVAVPTAAQGDLVISSNTTVIDRSAAEYSLIKGRIIIPASVRTIQQSAFANCNNITEVIFTGRDQETALSTCTSIGADAFANCSNLRKVEIPETFYGSCTFADDVFKGNQANLLLYIFAQHGYGTDTTKELERARLENEKRPANTTTGVKAAIGVPFQNKVVLLNKGSGIWEDGSSENPRVWLVEKNDEYKYPLGDTYPIKSSNPNQSFICWCDDDQDQDQSKRYYTDTAVNSDLSLYPIFDTEYTVSFNYRDSSDYSIERKTSFTVRGLDTLGERADLIPVPQDISTPKKERQFLHWKRVNGGRTYDNNTIKSFKVQSNEIFEAVYTDIYTVNFWLNTDQNVLLLSANVPYGKAITDGIIYVNNVETNITDFSKIIENAWVKETISNNGYDEEHYEFSGWYEDGTSLPWASAASVYSDVDLYYRYIRYIKIEYDYGTEYMALYPTEKTEERVKFDIASSSHKLPMYKAFPKHYFEGWRNERTNEIVVGGEPISQDTKYTAVWKDVYTVSFYQRIDRDDPSQYEKIDGADIEVVDGHEIGPDFDKVKKPIDLGTGDDTIAFSEWNTNPEPDTSGEIINRNKVVTGNMALYAHYVVGHGVRFISDSNEVGWAVIKHGESLKKENFPDVKKRGQYDIRIEDGSDEDFEKASQWNRKQDGSGDKVTTSTVVNSAITAYAVWKDDPSIPDVKQVTVSFNSMGGSPINHVSFDIDTPVSRPSDPIYENHKLVGWYTDKDYKIEWNFNDPVTEDMTLYAKWIVWTEEDEDNAHGIYWARTLKGGKVSLAEYFREGGLTYSYDKSVAKLNKKSRVVKGKRNGETLITATKVDGSAYETSVRLFVYTQKLKDMQAFNTSTSINAVEYLTVSGFLPDRWESSKPKVASIDQKTGIITVRGRGKTKIRAYYGNKACTATLFCGVPKFAKSFYRMKTGQTKQMKIKKIKKSDIVSWNVISGNGVSSNSGGTTNGVLDGVSTGSGNGVIGIGTAEIDANGKLTALTAGEVTVVATVYGQTLTCKVHIEPPILRKKAVTMNINKTKRLKLSRTKLKNVEWKSTNDSVAYVDPVTGKIYGLKNGRATLKTTAGGVVNVCSVEVQDNIQTTKKPTMATGATK